MPLDISPLDLLFEIYFDRSGLLRWRLIDDAGRAIAVSEGGFNSQASAERSIANSAAARDVVGAYRVRVAA